jgi:hypothetical protein
MNDYTQWALYSNHRLPLMYIQRDGMQLGAVQKMTLFGVISYVTFVFRRSWVLDDWSFYVLGKFSSPEEGDCW